MQTLRQVRVDYKSLYRRQAWRHLRLHCRLAKLVCLLCLTGKTAVVGLRKWSGLRLATRKLTAVLQFKQPRCMQSSANTETEDCSDQGQQQQARSLSSKGCRHAVSAMCMRDTSVKQHKASADRINGRGCWCCARASTNKISLATPKLSRFFRNFAAAVDMLKVFMPPLDMPNWLHPVRSTELVNIS